MKRLIYLSMAMVVLIGLLPVATVAQPPGEAPGGSVSYDEWWVEEVTPGILPAGTAFDFCFFVGFISVEEYLDTFEADLPDSWTVNYVLDVPGNTGYPHFFGVIPGTNELYWISTGDRGAWEPGMYNFCANVTLPNCDGSPWNFEWRIWGDGGENGEPHYLDGDYGPVECHPVGVHLGPSSQEGSACWGDQITHTFDLLNLTGVDDSFSITADAQWPMNCPGSVYALDGETVPFQCTVDVPCGGSSDTATVTASGQGYSGSATATSFDTGWADQGTAPVATSGGAVVSWGGKLYLLGGTGSNVPVQIWDGSTWTLGAILSGTDDAGDACLGLDGDGNPVIDLPGGYGRSTFNRYNISTDTWTTVPFPAGFPSTGLAGVDVVSMLQHTGENVCYISGGRWQTGASNTLYAYHPDTVTLSDLDSFTYASSGITWHFSWWVPWVEGGAICIAGGADHDLIPYADSQCYVLATGVMNAPNVDLGPLPHTWALGGDAWRVHEGEYRIWGFGGLKLEGQIVPLQASFYATPGQGFTTGPTPVHAVSSLEGDNWNGGVWASNGSDSGFVGTALQEWLFPCPDCGGQNIQVTPESLYAQQCPDTQTEQTLQICNVGSGELTWSLSEGNPHWLESATPTGSEQRETQSASPAFAPYEAVAPSGTRTEASVPTVLWDQPAGEGPSAISSHWMDSEIGAWSADDFQNSERWTLTSITVQGEYAGDLHNAGMLYWCIYPDTGGVPPNWIPGADSGVCLRYAPSDPKVTIDDSNAPNVDVTVTIPPHGAVVPAYMDDLQAGHWWLIFYAEFWDLDAGFGWRPSDAMGLVDAQLLDPWSQFGGGATWTSWPPLGGPAALSFRLEGIASPVPWLSEDPTSGSLLGGQCANVAVTFDSTYPFYDSAPLYVDSNDPDDPRVEVQVNLDVLSQPEKVGFHWAPPNPMAGEEVAFTGTALGFSTQFAWDFGDGETGTGNPAMHTYAAPGQYDVTLTVSVGNPCAVSVVKTVTVYPPLTCTELFFDDFESGFNNWILQGLWHDELQTDVCGDRVDPFPSPEHAAYFADLEYEQEWGYCLYNLFEASYGSLELASDLDLSGVQIADLQFSSYAETECYGMDGCNWSMRNVEVSTDGGLVWAPIGSVFTEWEWVDSWFGLSEYTGGPVRLRFFFDSLWPSGWDFFGWMVDNVRVRTCTLVGEPDIDVDPLSLSAAVCPDGSEVQTLQVCNLGDLDLTWVASEDLEWLTVSPTAGTLGPGGCEPVSVEFFGPGSDPFDGVIAFTSNDPDEPLVEVAVSLTVLDPPHDAGFSWAPPEPLVGETITFQGWAQGSEPLDYAWDFGDGGSGLGPEATHAYTASGDYLVTLTVSNDCDSVQVQHNVHVYAGPLFRAEPESLSAVQCPDTVTSQWIQVCNDGDLPMEWYVETAPVFLEWLPPSGTVQPGQCQQVESFFDSTGRAPGYYSGHVQGPYDVDSFFDVYVELTVLDPPHDADFSWAPPEPLAGETITFQGWAQGSEPLDYAWDFGDGGDGGGTVITHAYAAPGDYLVTLTVSNDCDSVQVQHVVTVYPAGEPDIDVDPLSLSATVCPDGSEVQTLQVCNLGDLDLTWDASEDLEWLTVSPMAGTVIPGDCDSVQVEFFGPGSDPFDGVIALTSNDPDEPLVEVAVSLTVLDPPHDADFSWAPPEPIAGETVTFQGWAEGSDPLTYAWDFGDSGGGGGAVVTHAYAAPGDYLVTLTVSNDCNSVQVQHTVHVYGGPVLRIEPESLSAEQCPDTVTSQQVDVCNDGDIPFDWSVLSTPSWASWLPPSGTVDPGTCQTVDSTFDSTGLAPGTYGGYVDGTWWIDSFFDVYVELIVLDPPHDADFSWAPPEPIVGETVTFQGSAEGSEPLEYAWDFGDGGGGGGAVITHAYAEPGDYLVTLTVSNDCDWVQVEHTVTVVPWPTMHVAGIKMAYQYIDPDIHRVLAGVRIVDEDGHRVSGATVSGEWTLPNGRLRPQQRTTNLVGVARFAWRAVRFGEYQFCVLDVSKSGLVYDPNQNAETCDSITVPTLIPMR